MGAPVEFWFDFASTYSYVAAMRIDALASARGLTVAWRPFLLGPVFAASGMKDSPFNLNPARGRYMWRDLERLCAKYGLGWKKPSVFPRNSVLAGKVACLHPPERLGEFARAVFEASFVRDLDIADPAVLARLTDGLGGNGRQALEEAVAPSNKGRLRENTEQAMAHGIFGAPNVRVGEELFFGQDRLEDALDFAASSAR